MSVYKKTFNITSQPEKIKEAILNWNSMIEGNVIDCLLEGNKIEAGIKKVYPSKAKINKGIVFLLCFVGFLFVAVAMVGGITGKMFNLNYLMGAILLGLLPLILYIVFHIFVLKRNVKVVFKISAVPSGDKFAITVEASKDKDEIKSDVNLLYASLM